MWCSQLSIHCWLLEHGGCLNLWCRHKSTDHGVKYIGRQSNKHAIKEHCLNWLSLRRRLVGICSGVKRESRSILGFMKFIKPKLCCTIRRGNQRREPRRHQRKWWISKIYMLWGLLAKERERKEKSYHYLHEQIGPFPYRSILHFLVSTCSVLLKYLYF